MIVYKRKKKQYAILYITPVEAQSL